MNYATIYILPLPQFLILQLYNFPAQMSLHRLFQQQTMKNFLVTDLLKITCN